jgi:hypothetical protein
MTPYFLERDSAIACRCSGVGSWDSSPQAQKLLRAIASRLQCRKDTELYQPRNGFAHAPQGIVVVAFSRPTLEEKQPLATEAISLAKPFPLTSEAAPAALPSLPRSQTTISARTGSLDKTIKTLKPSKPASENGKHKQSASKMISCKHMSRPERA